MTLKNNRLYLLTGLALHTDKLHRKTARDTEREEVRGNGQLLGGREEKHTVEHSLNQTYCMAFGKKQKKKKQNESLVKCGKSTS